MIKRCAVHSHYYESDSNCPGCVEDYTSLILTPVHECPGRACLKCYPLGSEPKGKQPHVLKSDKTLFMDVDDTLVIWDKDKATYRPHVGHVNMIKRFKARGQGVVVWSAGGYEWALKIVKELQLEAYVDLVIAKPAWWADDLKADKVLIEENRIYLNEND